MEVDFSGEQFIPGKTSKRMEADFLARYNFAIKYTANKDVLDIACGAGYGSFLLKEGGAKSVDGVDIDPKMIEFAKGKYGGGKTDGINYFVGDLETFDSNRKYDTIICFESIEHVQNFRGGLKNLRNLLKEDGVLLITTPNRIITSPNCRTLNDKPGNPFHFQEFTVGELKNELKLAGFCINADDILGSRQQRYFKNRYLRRLYKIIFKPDIKSSSTFQKLRTSPRFIMITAHKI